MAKSCEVTDLCLFHRKISETNKFLDNLKSSEVDSMLKDFVQKFRNTSKDKNNTEIKHLHPHPNVKSTSPFKLCPLLHAEVGLWKTVFFGMVKTGCFDDLIDFKRYDSKKSKVIQKPIQQTKKISSSQPKDRKIYLRKSTFRHDVPVEQVLKEYRENTVYSKHRLSKIDSKAIYKALHSSKLKNQEIVPKNPICRSEETGTHIINLCFDKDDTETSSNKVTKATVNNQTKANIKPGINSKNQGIKKKTG
ncbi:hypothetical protein J437_LFUL001273 [Ladona fulva]|uniref:Uncharacterized protein n=1 Tax=Ladona fulva TaxID=123851 RepID=A0A8K0JT37_LADFU|nr:hypothetical protein J437_LFUL001273 [Ladona fulva]